MTEQSERAAAPQERERLEPEVQRQLLQLRASIDNIDASLIYLLAERFRCTQQVGALKAAHHLPPADPAREQSQLERLTRLAHDAQLDPEFAEKWFNFVVAEVIRHHQQIAHESR